jgi:tetratricopeptide (TPR) repeat protein
LASPFQPLPDGAPNDVDIQFTFDYNILSGRSPMSLKAPIQGANSALIADFIKVGGPVLSPEKYAELEKVCEKARATAEKNAPNDPGLANINSVLAVAFQMQDKFAAYFEQNRFSEAKPLLQRALKVREAAVGGNHVKVAPALSALALLYEREKNFSEAEPLFLRALTIHEAKFAPESFAVISDVRNLAECYRSQGKIQEAEDLMKRSPKDVLTTPSLLPWLIVK